MKAYTVYQPYAYATVAGIKHNETRPRRTNIRGRVAVHAAKKRCNKSGFPARLIGEIAYGKIIETEYDRGIENLKRATELAYGAVVGTVEIVDCVPVEEIADTLTDQERLLGDYSPGRFAWVLRNPQMFSKPIPARGQQGWWNWPFVVLDLPAAVGSTESFGERIARELERNAK